MATNTTKILFSAMKKNPIIYAICIFSTSGGEINNIKVKYT